MSEELQSQVGRLLAELAEQLGVAVEVVWAALIRQAYVEFVIWLLGGLLSIALVVELVKAHPRLERGEGEPSFQEVVFAIASVIVVAMVVITLGEAYDAITGLLNPEYWALKEIIGAFK